MFPVRARERERESIRSISATYLRVKRSPTNEEHDYDGHYCKRSSQVFSVRAQSFRWMVDGDDDDDAIQ